MFKQQLLIAAFGLCMAGASESSGAQAQSRPSQPVAGPGSISGIWRLEGYVPTKNPVSQRLLRDETGALPPMLPWAQAVYEQRIRDNDDHHPFAATSTYCLPLGMPQMMFTTSYPIQILETPGQVTMLFEMGRDRRLIYLNEPHAEDADPGFAGNSVGHWEGDTLVIDTNGLNDRMTVDLVGMPQSDAMHVAERVRRISPTQLEDVITIDDPKVFSRSWKTRHTYKYSPNDRLREYVCENNVDKPKTGANATPSKPPG